jgi:uncharacterized protein YbaP (TraB family)
MMSRIVTAIAAFSVLALPLQGLASPSQPASDANAPQKAAAAAATVTPAGNAKNLQPITVSAPIPHIWTYQRGNSKVLVLGTVYPEPEGLTFVPISIHRAIAQSGAVIGLPWFHFEANVNLFNVLPIWHAASGAKYLPDGKQLSDVLSPSDLQHWRAFKTQYLPHADKVDRMRPMFAAWQLYEAVLRHSGVAVDSSILQLIQHDARQSGVPMIDAQFYWTIKDPKTAAHAFEPSQQADSACFQSILSGIDGVPDSARTLAAAWAIGDVATMHAYVSTHTITRPCWSGVTQAAVAEQQGLDRDLEERKAWLAAFNTAAARYPVVFTTASVQDIFKPSRQIEWLMQDGYVLVQPDAAQTSAPTPESASTVPGSTTRAHGSW